jgi:acyl-CoA reductase-like NAD-dependent aldehyde dehydrogenase/nicotinamidase-related amidase
VSDRAQGAALLLVDLQNDFLARPGLIPDREFLCARAAALLDGMRRRGSPVVHAHTVIRADGSDCMPHWKRRGVRECVEGTRGALPPPALASVAGELVLRKRYFSAFGDARLDPWLRERGVNRLIVAGVYLHSCVRSTVLDAYERGYEVCVVDDAVGTTEPVHAELTRTYLGARAASFQRSDEVLADLRLAEPHAAPVTHQRLPVAVVAATLRPAGTHAGLIHRNPCRTAEVLWEVPLGTSAEIEEAARTCEDASRPWARAERFARAEFLERWAGELERRRGLFTNLIVREVGKPRRAAEEEIGRAVAHARIAAELAREPAQALRVAPGVVAAQRPLGVVGLVTPWNNPLAIPVGKIAPALAFGNAVVLKPAPRASATALAILDSLDRAGLPPGLVNVVLGDAAAALALCRDSRMSAISITGSIASGRALAAICAESMKPLQAELGGNNAAIILKDADLDDIVPGLVHAAFGFAGQRCTAIRRFVVERTICSRFEALAREAANALAIGEPDDPATVVGPLVCAEKRDQVITVIERAVADGARLVTGGFVPRGLAHGAWVAPALLADVDARSRIAQEETFGPVAVILPASDLDDALTIANGVAQGLVMSLHTRDAKARLRVLEAAQAGIVQLASGPLAVHPKAPFSGWKASGLGPPEHGIWDAAFYARVQAVYTDESC